MLNRIHVQNYKCLLDVAVDLGEFTVLIGPNDSGKSSFLEVVQALGKIAREPYQNVFTGNRSLGNLVWRKESKRNIIWEVTGSASRKAFKYHVELPVDQRIATERLEFDGASLFQTEGKQIKFKGRPLPSAPGWTALAQWVKQAPQLARQHAVGVQDGYPGLADAVLSVAEALTSTVEYRFQIDKLCVPSVPEPDAALHASGDNLASVLDALLSSPDRSAFAALESSLHQAVPTLRGVALRPVRERTGAKTVEFILSGDGQPAVTIPAVLASGGALLLTAFLALAYSQTPGLLLLEEPENGLHPSRLELVINILRKLSTGEVGNRKRQVILTTHSPLLLNYLKPEEVRIFVRDPQRGTQVTPMTHVPDIDKLLKEFAVGELWYLLGEEKLLEGKPA